MGNLLASCQRATPVKSTLTWVPADFLRRNDVAPWTDMPCWIPAQGDEAGFGRVSVARAVATGLAYRPLDETVRDTLAWWQGQPDERKAVPKAGITAEREATVLKAWHASGEAVA